MTYRVRNITIAVVLALVAALLTSFYVTNYQRNVRQGEENVTVWVASSDIPAGTAGSEIVRKNMFDKGEIVRRSVVPGSITNPAQIENLITTQPIYAGEQVTTRRFATPAQRGIRAQISGTTRAMQLAGDQHQLLAGTLKAGDRVDIVASLKVGDEGDSHVTRTILRDIEVLKAAASPNVTDQNIAGSSQNLFVQLALTDAQAQKMFHVRQHGTWSLELRPPAKANDSPESLTWFGSIIRDGIQQAQLDQLTGGGN